MGKNFYAGSDGFPDRIRKVVEIVGTINSFSKKVGASPTSVKRWIDGKSDPSRSNLINIADASGVSLSWLATGEGLPFPDRDDAFIETAPDKPAPVFDATGKAVDIDEFVFIPRYNVEAAAGAGYGVENENIRFPMAFRKYWVEGYLGANPADLSVISVTGDSMAGLLEDGDVILVNHAKNTPAEGIYVVRIGNDIVVKRTQLLPGGILLLKSENEAYEPFRVNIDEDSTVAVIGKVEWFGRQI